MTQHQLEQCVASAPIDREEFYTGLLLNLHGNEHVKGVWMNHELLRAALAEALRAVRDDDEKPEIEGVDWEVLDDAYRQSRLVHELIAFGQSSRLISLQTVDLERGGARERTEHGRELLLQAVGRRELFHRAGRAFAGKMT